jgi:predicted transcriptional regulator
MQEETLRMTTKEKMKELIEEQPDDASYDEILRELTFARMVERGLADSREGRAVSNAEMARRIRSW